MLQINKIPRKKEPIFQGQKIPVFQDHNTQDAPTVQYNLQNIIPYMKLWKSILPVIGIAGK